MNSVLLIRILLSVVAFSIIILLFKLHRAIKLDRRITRYSLKIESQEELSYFDKIGSKYHKLVGSFQKNKVLMKYSSKYQKYIPVGEKINAIQFLINKLVIASCFVTLVIISYAIQGKLISFIGFIFSFIKLQGSFNFSITRQTSIRNYRR